MAAVTYTRGGRDFDVHLERLRVNTSFVGAEKRDAWSRLRRSAELFCAAYQTAMVFLCWVITNSVGRYGYVAWGGAC